MINKNEVPIIEPKNVFTGKADAPVTLMEFEDYETPEALTAHEIVKELLQSYEGKIKFVFRHFPLLRIHQKAHKAAEASIAAAQSGMFWEMHEILLNNRRNLGTISLKSYAREIGIKDKNFLNDLINSKYGWFVQDDLKEGIRLGVQEIPSFFINGTKVDEPLNIEQLKATIDAALRQSKKKILAG